MNNFLHFTFLLAHKLRFVWAFLVCIIAFVHLSFYDFETVAHRVTNLHFSTEVNDTEPQNLFYESTETEQRDDEDSEPNKAHCAPLAYASFGIFFIKKRSTDHIFIACFENEAIEEETPPPDVTFAKNPLLFIC